jgi:hypothetical protein
MNSGGCPLGDATTKMGFVFTHLLSNDAVEWWRLYNGPMDCPEMESLKRDVLRGSDGQDCFVLSMDDEAEGRAAEEHILQWLADRGLGHSVWRHGDSVYVSPLPLTGEDWQEVLASDTG